MELEGVMPPWAVQLDQSGLFYYLIPAGFRVYRGDTEAYLGSKTSPNQQWYLTEQSKVTVYGLGQEFVTVRPLKLLALDYPPNVRLLASQAPEVTDDLLSSFQLKPHPDGSEFVYRVSEAGRDKRVLAALCAHGFQGFAARPLRSEVSGGLFHAEVVICQPQEALRYVGALSHTDEQVSEAKQRQLALQLKRRREQSRRRAPPRSQEDDSDFSSVPRSLSF